MKNREINYSEEFQDAVSRFPKFNSILFYSLLILVFTIIILMSVIKSPEIVLGEARVTAEKPPIEIVSQNSGKLILKNFEPQKTFKKGDYLAVIENSSNEEDILRLKTTLIKFNNSLFNLKYKDISYASTYNLGELEQPFFELLNTLYKIEKEKGYSEIDAKKEVLNRETTKYFEMISKRGEIKKIKSKEISLLKTKLIEDSILVSKGLITKIEFDNTKRNYYNAKENLKNYEYKDVENSYNISDNVSNINLLNVQERLNLSDLQIKLVESYNMLLQQINLWESRFIIKMPIDGKVDMLQFISTYQFIKQGEPLFSVLPNDNHFVAQLMIPPNGAGKVKINQDVSIKLPSYPYQEFGKIEGKVKSISLIPSQNYYLIWVKLPKGLKSDTGNELSFSKNMVGQAEIVTNKRSLLAKLFSKIINAFEKNDTEYFNEKIKEKQKN